MLTAAAVVAPLPAAAELFAERLTATNIDARRLVGPDAIAGLGDYVLGNGVVCAAVSAPGHEAALSDGGGVLIDLGHCGRGDDQWGVLQPMLNLSRDSTLPVTGLTARVADGRAQIVASGQADGLWFSTTYSVDHQHPERILVETLVERRSDGDALFLIGDVVLHGHRQLTAFTVASRRPRDNVGFAHPPVEIDSAFSMVDAMVRADTQVLVGGSHLEPGIAYGWRIVDAHVERRDGERETLPHLGLNGRHFSILGVYADTLIIGGVGRPDMFEMAQTLFMDLDSGERLVYAREIALGRRADVASVTDRLWPEGPVVTGRLDDPAAGLHVFDDAGTPITFVRPDADGRFSFRLPDADSKRYELRAQVGDEVRAIRRLPAQRDGGAIDAGQIGTGPTALLELPQGEPVRLIFAGVPPTRDPVLGADALDFLIGDVRVPSSTESKDLSLAGVPSDPKVLRLPPGRYRVLATRGPEWSIGEATVDLAPGARVPLEIDLPIRVVEAPGRVSADFHVHAAPSDDSSLPLRMRLAAFAAMGAEVLVSTEHDVVFDYGPSVRAMGLEDRITSLVGVEITSTMVGPVTPFTSGHANAFPLAPRPRAYRAGAPRAENRRLRDVIADLRGRAERPILQLNHPRESGTDQGLGSYLSHLAVSGEPFDPTRPLDAEPNRPFTSRAGNPGLRDFDFDAIELLNAGSMEAYRLARGDWLSWLLQGERRTGTANSDSHSTGHPVGLPRSYVAYTGGLGRDFEPERFMAAVRQGRITGSSGPVLDVSLGDAGPGETFTGRSGELRVGVRRASWVPVDEIRVYVNGALVERTPPSADGTLRVPLRFEADAFVTVEVEGAAAPGSIYGRIAPGHTPFAFTNPVFVDADGRPGWTAPGLPDPLPPAIAEPLATP